MRHTFTLKMLGEEQTEFVPDGDLEQAEITPAQGEMCNCAKRLRNENRFPHAYRWTFSPTGTSGIIAPGQWQSSPLRTLVDHRETA